MNRKPQQGDLAIGCITLVVLAVGLSLLVGWCRRSPSPGPTEPEPLALTGDPCVIAASDGGDTLGATTLDGFERYRVLLRADDSVGVSGMLLDGRLLMIAGGTRGKVIDLHVWKGVYEVRIHDGPHAGRSAFVAEVNVKRSDRP